MWNINALQVRIPWTIFYKICTSFQDALAIKVSLDLLKGLWSYGVFNLMGSSYPKFLVPLAAKLCITPQTFLRCKNVLEVFYHHTKFGVARISPAAGLAKKRQSFFVCPSRFFVRHASSVHHAFERQSLFTQFRHEDVGEQKWFWCRWIGEGL